MTGFVFGRAITFGSLVLVALAVHAGPGLAQSSSSDVYEKTYSGPPIIRRIPGLRLLFGDEAMSEDQYNQLYGDKKKKKKIDESYYEPQPSVTSKPKVVKPPTPKTASAPANPGMPQKTASAPANPALPQKTATAASVKPATGGPLSCEKATEVVAGFGFSSVEASSCSGKLYAFNAKRGGKSFAIKLNPASGELTEVKKLP